MVTEKLLLACVKGPDFWGSFFKTSFLFRKKCHFWPILNAALNFNNGHITSHKKGVEVWCRASCS